jgi:hypothetical protein
LIIIGNFSNAFQIAILSILFVRRHRKPSKPSEQKALIKFLVENPKFTKQQFTVMSQGIVPLHKILKDETRQRILLY